MIAGIVLAAGRSSRLGRPKQLLPLHGEPLLRHTLRRALATGLDEVIVVLGHQADAVRTAIADLPVRVVVNADAALGQSTSVVAGLASLPPEASAALFLLGDQPSVDPAVVDDIIAAWEASGASVVAPRYLDGIGNPVLFSRRVFPELMALGGDVGARAIVRKYQSSGELLIVDVDIAAPRDVDSDEDYAALLASCSEETRETSERR